LYFLVGFEPSQGVTRELREKKATARRSRD
jgi:hypothetical protein